MDADRRLNDGTNSLSSAPGTENPIESSKCIDQQDINFHQRNKLKNDNS